MGNSIKNQKPKQKIEFHSKELLYNIKSYPIMTMTSQVNVENFEISMVNLCVSSENSHFFIVYTQNDEYLLISNSSDCATYERLINCSQCIDSCSHHIDIGKICNLLDKSSLSIINYNEISDIQNNQSKNNYTINNQVVKADKTLIIQLEHEKHINITYKLTPIKKSKFNKEFEIISDSGESPEIYPDRIMSITLYNNAIESKKRGRRKQSLKYFLLSYKKHKSSNTLENIQYLLKNFRSELKEEVESIDFINNFPKNNDNSGGFSNESECFKIKYC